MKKCILFTDIKGSSCLFKNHPKQMLKALRSHNSQIRSSCRKYSGFIIKTIGDAYMIRFNNIYDAIDFSIRLCQLQVEKPITVANHDKINIRIGMCYGTVNQRRIMIQNKSLLDYFGPTVNIASRMESKVSQVGGFAFCINGDKKHNRKILNYLNDNNLKIEMTYFMDDLKCKENLKRSERLFSAEQIHGYKCKDPEILKGVGGDIITYECQLNM
jgi:hypothetical protein